MLFKKALNDGVINTLNHNSLNFNDIYNTRLELLSHIVILPKYFIDYSI
jgi:hypothetical protein